MEHKKLMHNVIYFYLPPLSSRISCALGKGTLTWSRKTFLFKESTLDIKNNKNSKLHKSPKYLPETYHCGMSETAT